MKVAIIGTGFIASVHLEALLSQGHLITLVIGSSEESAKNFANKYNIKNFTSNIDHIDSEEIDIVHICTPPALHYEVMAKCIRYNKHILCEKPLCLSKREALDLIKLSNSKKLKIAVNFNVRFHSLMKSIKKTVQSDDFGEVFLTHGKYLQEFHALPSEYSWRYDDKLAGDMRAVTEIGSHMIDLIPYLTDLEVDEVLANYTYVKKERFIKDNIMYSEKIDGSIPLYVDTEDAASITLRFSNGSTGHFIFSEVSHGRNNNMKFEITGSNQSIWWSSERPYEYSTASKRDGVKVIRDDFANGFKETINSLIKNFYDSILSLSDVESYDYPNLIDGYKNVIICSALHESSRNNASWIKIKYDLQGDQNE